MKDKQDVVVISGGHAGSTVASYVAKKGPSVTVLEKEKFPRIHVGESLLPCCYSLFQELGILDQMKKRNGEEEMYRARFLIDTSGRSSFLATKNGWRKPHKEFERTAFWTHWKNVKSLKGGLEEGASLIMYLGGEKRGWSWIFPLGLNQVTAGVVMDTSYLRHQKQEVFGNSQDWATALYLQELMSSEFARDLLDDAKIAMPIQVEGDYSYYSEKKFGARYALVGDAGRFIDPIFSSGVYLSMKSGSLVANALDEMLASNNLDDNAPLEQVYKTINGAYDLVYQLISLFYNPHAISFAEAG